MSDIVIAKRDDVDGYDVLVENGDLVLTRDRTRALEVIQRVWYRLLWFFQEHPYDRSVGIAYFDLVFGQLPDPSIVNYLTGIIADTEGVDSIATDPVLDLTDDNTLAITVELLIGSQPETISIEVTPP